MRFNPPCWSEKYNGKNYIFPVNIAQPSHRPSRVQRAPRAGLLELMYSVSKRRYISHARSRPRGPGSCESRYTIHQLYRDVSVMYPIHDTLRYIRYLMYHPPSGLLELGPAPGSAVGCCCSGPARPRRHDKPTSHQISGTPVWLKMCVRINVAPCNSVLLSLNIAHITFYLLPGHKTEHMYKTRQGIEDKDKDQNKDKDANDGGGSRRDEKRQDMN
jgi:hypothetical protein